MPMAAIFDLLQTARKLSDTFWRINPEYRHLHGWTPLRSRYIMSNVAVGSMLSEVGESIPLIRVANGCGVKFSRQPTLSVCAPDDGTVQCLILSGGCTQTSIPRVLLTTMDTKAQSIEPGKSWPDAPDDLAVWKTQLFAHIGGRQPNALQTVLPALLAHPTDLSCCSSLLLPACWTNVPSRAYSICNASPNVMCPSPSRTNCCVLSPWQQRGMWTQAAHLVGNTASTSQQRHPACAVRLAIDVVVSRVDQEDRARRATP